jgi:hypothetical protein
MSRYALNARLRRNAGPAHSGKPAMPPRSASKNLRTRSNPRRWVGARAMPVGRLQRSRRDPQTKLAASPTISEVNRRSSWRPGSLKPWRQRRQPEPLVETGKTMQAAVPQFPNWPKAHVADFHVRGNVGEYQRAAGYTSRSGSDSGAPHAEKSLWFCVSASTGYSMKLSPAPKFGVNCSADAYVR